jgi:Ca2+-binding EF-hand superfamily protein
MERFDRNHDGRLDPEERRHAIHALRRMARRMEVQDRRDERGAARREERMRELVRRYDRNGDGVVGPDEMPPGLARRLQRLDRNGDGWLDERDR